MPDFIVERYEIDSTSTDAEAAVLRVAAAVKVLRDGGADVELIDSKYVPADEAAYTYFRAASVQLVEAAHGQAGVPYERIVETVPLPVKEETA